MRTWTDVPTFHQWGVEKTVPKKGRQAGGVISATQERKAQLTLWDSKSIPGWGGRCSVPMNGKGKGSHHFHPNFMRTCASEGCSGGARESDFA